MMRAAPALDGGLPESAVRGVLRAQLEVLLGGEVLYNPIFCGPVPSAHVLSEEVHAVAGSRAIPVVVGGGGDQNRVGVWLMDVERADQLLAGGASPTTAVQWVVSADCDAAALPDRLAAWLARGGFTIRPPAGGIDDWSVEGAVRDAVEASRDGAAFAVVVASRGSLPTVASELFLHLELQGASDPRRVSLTEGPRWLRAPTGTGVLTLRGEDVEHLDAAEVVRAVESASQVCGIVFDAAAFTQASSDPSWRGVLDRAFVVQRAVERTSLPAGVAPVLEHVLVGGGAAAGTEAAMSFHLALVGLGQVLQTAESWESAAELVVYSPVHFARVLVSGGRVHAVSPHPTVQLSDAVETDVFQALVGIASWQEASVALVPRADLQPIRRGSGVSVANAVFALAMGAEAGTPAPDEVPPMRAHEVAERLVECGLSSIAVSLLERAERAAAWGAEEDALLGRLVATRDPQGAALRLRHAAVRALGGGAPTPALLALYVGATLNALLIEVRGGARVPASAWSVVSEWIQRAGTAWVLSPQHAAIWMELALRAGARESAGEAQARLRVLGGGHPAWAGLLALDLHGNGSQ
jgi:hypothetical protein